MRVTGVFSVMQSWRVPYFSRLLNDRGVSLTIVHGQDFEGTKRTNYKGNVPFNRSALEQRQWITRATGNDAPLVLFKRLWATLDQTKPEVLLLEGASNLLNAFSSLIWAKFHRVPVVWWTLGELPGRKYSLLGRAYRRVVAFIENRCDVLLLYSTQALEYARRIGVPAERCVVAVNVVDTEKWAAEAKPLEEQRDALRERTLGGQFPTVVYVGALAAGKKLERFVPLFSAIKRRVPDSKLLVIGDGPLRPRLEQSFQEAGLSGSVVFVGERTTDVAGFFICGDVFVMPGLGGLAISHSLAHGVPVVCSSGDGVERDLVIDGQTGFLLSGFHDEAQLIEGLAERAAKILMDSDLRERLSAEGKKLVTTRYTQTEMVCQMHRALELARSRRATK